MATTADPRQLRDALGAFATGVTIVTTQDADGNDIGLTANSFNSVSLDPPMVLWSLAKSAQSRPAFLSTDYFAVHILSSGQEALSNQFAKRGVDKFAGVEITRGVGKVPLLDGCAARFQCQMAFRYEGGDHDIFVGNVVEFEHFDRAPLIYHRGKYGLVVKTAGHSNPPAERGDGSFTQNFLGFLLAQAHFQLFDAIRSELKQHDINLNEYFALCALGAGKASTTQAINKMAQFYDCEFTQEMAERLIARGLVEAPAAALKLTETGFQMMLKLLAIGKDAEAHAQEDFEYEEAQLLRNLLKRLTAAAAKRLSAPAKS
jgi:3-hydroxy-9,10-secoandrosta-1,3,5(10)-triene-9,17-dione monooxygenase reductase component